jgi:hypothetical protein
MPRLTRQSLPSYFHSRLSAVGGRQRDGWDCCFSLASDIVIQRLNKTQLMPRYNRRSTQELFYRIGALMF